MVHVHCTNQYIDPFCPVYGYRTKKNAIKTNVANSNKKSILFLSLKDLNCSFTDKVPKVYNILKAFFIAPQFQKVNQ